MELRICVFLAAAVVGVLSNKCASPNDACECASLTSMLCRNAAAFPTDLPESVTMLVLDNCSPEMFSTPNTFPGDLGYPNLETLHVVNCKVQDIAPGAFMSMPMLKVLDFSNNELTIINKADFSHLGNLEDLNLAVNGLIDLKDDVFENVPTLVGLNLDGNKISDLKPKTFEVISGTLSKLHIESCDLQAMPTEVLSQLPNLVDLEMNDNPIKEIPDGTWDNLGNLRRLDMNQCQLGNIGFTSSTFRNLNNLQFLNLGFNEINEIPPGTFDAFKSTLRSLYIEHNQLTTLDSGLLMWASIDALNISSNPWNCDCSIQWMADLSLSIDGFTTHVSCDEPAAVKGENLHNVTSTLQGCPGPSRSSVIALAITIPIIIVCAGFIGYYLYKIIQARRTRGQRKSVRYSEVYRDTVESTNKPPRPPRPVSEL